MLISGILIITASHADSMLHEGSRPEKILQGPISTADIHLGWQRNGYYGKLCSTRSVIILSLKWKSEPKVYFRLIASLGGVVCAFLISGISKNISFYPETYWGKHPISTDILLMTVLWLHNISNEVPQDNMPYNLRCLA